MIVCVSVTVRSCIVTLTLHHYAWPRHSVYVYYALHFLDIRKNRVIMAKNQAEWQRTSPPTQSQKGSLSSVMHIVGYVLWDQGVQSVIAQASLENMWLQITDQSPPCWILGRVSVYSRYSILLSSVQTRSMHADNEWLCIGESSHSTFASSRICGYSSVGRYSGRHFTYSSICNV